MGKGVWSTALFRPFGQNVELALQTSTDAVTDIRDTGVVFLLERSYSELQPSTTHDFEVDNFFGQFPDTYVDATEILDVKQSHIAVVDNFDDRIKIKKSVNLKWNMTQRDQDIVELQIQLGHRNHNEAS